jgi:hypothetical protein
LEPILMTNKNMRWQDLMDEDFANEVSEELDRHTDPNYITEENWIFF